MRHTFTIFNLWNMFNYYASAQLWDLCSCNLTQQIQIANFNHDCGIFCSKQSLDLLNIKHKTMSLLWMSKHINIFSWFWKFSMPKYSQTLSICVDSVFIIICRNMNQILECILSFVTRKVYKALCSSPWREICVFCKPYWLQVTLHSWELTLSDY